MFIVVQFFYVCPVFNRFKDWSLICFMSVLTYFVKGHYRWSSFRCWCFANSAYHCRALQSDSKWTQDAESEIIWVGRRFERNILINQTLDYMFLAFCRLECSVYARRRNCRNSSIVSSLFPQVFFVRFWSISLYWKSTDYPDQNILQLNIWTNS